MSAVPLEKRLRRLENEQKVHEKLQKAGWVSLELVGLSKNALEYLVIRAIRLDKEPPSPINPNPKYTADFIVVFRGTHLEQDVRDDITMHTVTDR